WCLTPRMAEDDSAYTWPDGELVTPDKLAAWLKEDILLRRVKAPAVRREPRGPARRGKMAADAGSDTEAEAAAFAEAQVLAETLGVPLAESVQLLADDREDYVPPAAVASVEEGDKAAVEGTLLTRGTLDAYVAAVIELWRLQVAHRSHNIENPRGAVVRGFLE
ncbi:hypothetical protein N658DRAFT_387653, partial [Parathielavia hyrcaniae]